MSVYTALQQNTAIACADRWRAEDPQRTAMHALRWAQDGRAQARSLNLSRHHKLSDTGQARRGTRPWSPQWGDLARLGRGLRSALKPAIR